ncbi:MAG: hypothetical protein HQ536_02595 [Parcubacteria group bacterium]|nr:hypothetical protein [Parcubacteria group bacterium]
MVCWRRIADKIGLSEALKKQEKEMTYEEANQLIANRMIEIEKEVGHEPTAIEKKLKKTDKKGMPYWKKLVAGALNDYRLLKSITVHEKGDLQEDSVESKEKDLQKLDLKITALAGNYDKLEREIRTAKKKGKKKKKIKSK